MNRKYLLLSFLTPLLVRTVPEILSWPYPIGFDTLIYAGAAINEKALQAPPQQIFKTTSLLYIIYTLLYKLLGDPLLPAKILGPVLTGLVGLAAYHLARALSYPERTALLASALATTYFVALRISWEMYRQMLATIFLLAYLATESRNPKGLKLLALPALAFLTAWSHEFITVILMTHAFIQTLTSPSLKEAAQRALPSLPAAILFLYQLYNPQKNTLEVFHTTLYYPSQLQFTAYALGFLAYLYLPLAPLLAFGLQALKTPPLKNWTATCLTLTLLPAITPNMDFLWFRWTILLVYPIAFASALGAEKLLNGQTPLKPRTARVIALSTLILNAVFTATYLVLPPEHQYNKYFGDWNPYKHYIQTSMLQSSIPLHDVEPTIQAALWVDSQPGNKTLVLHEAFHNWAQLYARNTKLVRVNEQKLSSPIRENTSRLLLTAAQAYSRNSIVYTIWWLNNTWYNMTTPPPQFTPVKTFKDIAVYIYNP